MRNDALPEAIRAELANRQALEALITSLGGKMTSGNNCRCPFHQDSRPSATIKQGEDGVWRFKCHDQGCGVWGNTLDLKERAGLGTKKEAFVAARQAERPAQVGPDPSHRPADDSPSYGTLEELVASYGKNDAVYKYVHPETNRIELVVLRLPEWNKKKDALDKTFRQAHQRPDGRWVKKKPDGLLPIYNRSRLRSADWCIVVEGEKKVHILADLGIVATTSPMGAGKARLADWSPLRGKRTYLWPDNDAIDPKTGNSKGHEHMRQVAEILQSIDCEVYLVDPDGAGLERDGSDVVDFLDGLKCTPTQKRDAIDAVLGQARPLAAAAELFERLEACIDGTYRDVGFPWPAINRQVQALLPGAVTVLCGSPGSAKTYFLLDALMYWLRVGVRVACYMLEHDKAYWLQRCLAMLAGESGLVNVAWVKDHPDMALGARDTHRCVLESVARLIDISPSKPVSHAELLEWLEARSAAGCRILSIDPITGTAPPERPWMADLEFLMRAKYLARERGFSLLLVTHPRVTGKRTSPLDDVAGGAAFQRFTQTVLALKSHYPPREVEYICQYGHVPARINRSLMIAKASNGRQRYALVLMTVVPIQRLSGSRWAPLFRQLSDLDDDLFAFIAARRRGDHAPAGQNVLDDLLAAAHEDGTLLGDREVRDALLTILIAGHDTTALALAWALGEIAGHPEVVDRLGDELARVTGGGPPEAGHLPALEYLEGVIRESLRLRPVAPFVARKTVRPFAAGGRQYPAAVVLCPCSYLVHRREDLYPKPDRFRPERFLERNFGPHEWFPFGGGNRVCLGMPFALYEMKVLLATVLSQVRPSRPAGAQSKARRYGIVLGPDDGGTIVVRPTAWPAKPPLLLPTFSN